jgi:hypothetical protein
MTSIRVVPIAVFAAVTAAVIAWALRSHARFLPTAPVPRHVLSHSHGAADYVPPAPVTGLPLVNYAGLIMLAIHLTALGIVVAAWGVRRYFRRRDIQGVPARLSFAVLVSVTAAAVTIPIAAVSLGSAILFTGTLTAAMTVLQYTFVLGVVGAAILGVP